MGPERPNEETIFAAALGKTSPAERQAYLDEVCGEDKALRGRVEARLKARDEAGGFVEMSALGQDAALGAVPLTEGPGTLVGRYKLLQQIGEGGMGVVFMAEQQEPVRRVVALKIIKPGMDTRQVIARFEAERQALALMDHPNIARVLDAGATGTGRPYFVMELVKGVPITEYCDSNRLSPAERLGLFTEVCHAVQHAHQKGIIHRDLKPSNVLVTLHDGKPVPKIIDFGVAKATSQRLTERTMFTHYGQMIGTPAYMAPEQAEMSGLDMDTRSDIYSLGVLLYELLTGTRPFDEKQLREAGYGEMLRIIREQEPPKPSTRLSTLKDTLASVAAQRHTEPARLTRLVRGDLDWIVMKTLEKDRTRRYETANGLALDIQHYLVHEPVLASPPSKIYRMRKFLRRHRTGVAAGSAVFLALAAGLVAATTGFFEANRERRIAVAARLEAEDQRRKAEQAAEQARQSAEEARAVTAFFQETLASIDPRRARGREVTVREVFDRIAKEVGEKFAKQPLTEAAIRTALGSTYGGLGDYAASSIHFSAAAEIRRRLLGEGHPDTLGSMDSLAGVLKDQGKYAEAEQVIRPVVEIRQRVLPNEHPDTVDAMHQLADMLIFQDKNAEAEQLYRQVLPVRERLLPVGHLDILYPMNNLAEALRRQGKCAEAAPYSLRVIEGCVRGEASQPDASGYGRLLAAALVCGGNTVWGMVTSEDPALRSSARASELAEAAVKARPDNCYSWGALGFARYRAGDWRGAVESIEKSVLLSKDGGQGGHFFFLAMAQWQLGDKAKARQGFDRGVAWANAHDSQDAESRRLWSEAAALLGLPGPPPKGPEAPRQP
jgi:serine/threonine protein kinase